MKLTLIREPDNGKYTAGTLYIDGKEFCKTLEPSASKPSHPGHPCIPPGNYEITLNVKSPKFSDFHKYPYLEFTEGKMPRLLDVPMRSGILIHAGNGRRDTYGCILVGQTLTEESLDYSRVTFQKLYRRLKEWWPGKIWIEIRGAS